jgi:NAD(P)H-dependent flavin oxidoreductase YrpB (nitropropane dioxygenase family)
MEMTTTARHDSRPRIIQGGMGIAVSSWRLARRVAELGEIGVVSATAIDTVLVRELQDGDPSGRLRVLDRYPDQEIVGHLRDRYFVEGGKSPEKPYRLLPMHRFNPTLQSQRILSAATFAEVALAKDGHDGYVGINLLCELKRYTLPCLYGAMLAGVDAVMMGAGIPLEEARLMPDLAAGRPVRSRSKSTRRSLKSRSTPFTTNSTLPAWCRKSHLFRPPISTRSSLQTCSRESSPPNSRKV